MDRTAKMRVNARLNARLLGRALLVLAVLVVLAVGGVFGYSRWKAAKVWSEIQRRIDNALAKPFCTDCNYAPNINGRVPFRLHARRGEQIAPGKFAMHDARVTLYSADGKREDYIYGAEFEYDQKAEIVRALGEVQMDLQAPDSLTRKPGDAEAAEKPQKPIHVRTSELVYMRRLGVAATTQPVEIRYGGITCTGVGADFETGMGLVRLLRDVHISGSLQREQGTLDAASASMNRSTDQLEFTEPRAVSGARRGRASHALLFLRKDGSIEHGEADGAVYLAAAGATGSREVRSQRLELTANSDNVVRTARLLGGVTLVGTEPGRPMRGEANTADLRFNSAGRIEDLLADGHASLHTEELGNGHATRDIGGDRVHAVFTTPDGPRSAAVLTAMEAHGAAVARFDQPVSAAGKPAGQRQHTELRGDDLRTTFVAEKAGTRQTAELRGLTAQGHTSLDEHDTAGGRSSSAGDSLEASFASGDGGRGAELVSAVQTGHVRLTSFAAPRPAAQTKAATPPAEWRGTAARAAFDGATEVLTLTADAAGTAQVTDGATEIAAREVKLHRLTGDGEAAGRVTATLWGDPSKGGSPAAHREATHVEADRARLLHSVDQAEFLGTAAYPARLWQGASQVLAARLDVDGVRKTLAARPEGASDYVRANFAEKKGLSPAAKAGSGLPSTHGGTGRMAEVRPSLAEAWGAGRVVAGRMDYSDTAREAVFEGGPGGKVRMEFAGGEGAADRGTVFLVPAKPADADASGAAGLGSSLDRAVLLGHVEVRQPERTGTGDQLTYTAADQHYVLTGGPGHLPRLDDRRQGNVTGSTLLFSSAESSIVVAGAPASEKGRTGRVRTELELKP